MAACVGRGEMMKVPAVEDCGLSAAQRRRLAMVHAGCATASSGGDGRITARRKQRADRSAAQLGQLRPATRPVPRGMSPVVVAARAQPGPVTAVTVFEPAEFHFLLPHGIFMREATSVAGSRRLYCQSAGILLLLVWYGSGSGSGNLAVAVAVATWQWQGQWQWQWQWQWQRLVAVAWWQWPGGSNKKIPRPALAASGPKNWSANLALPPELPPEFTPSEACLHSRFTGLVGGCEKPIDRVNKSDTRKIRALHSERNLAPRKFEACWKPGPVRVHSGPISSYSALVNQNDGLSCRTKPDRVGSVQCC